MDGLRGEALALAAEQLSVTAAAEELCVSGSRFAVTGHLISSGADETVTSVTDGVWQAVLSCWEDRSHLLSATQRGQLATVLQAASELLETLLFCPQHFLQCLIKQQLPRVPLEVVCCLHTASLVTLEAFLKASGAALQYVVTAVASLSCERSVSAEAQRRVMQIMADEVCGLVMKQCPEAVEVVEQLPGAMLAQPLLTYSLLRASIASPSIATAEVGAIMLSSHLGNPATSMLEVVPLQTQWQFSSLTQPTTSLYSDILSVLGTTYFIELLQKALSVEQLNWLSLLQAVVCFLHHDQSTPRKLTELVEKLVLNGLDEGDSHLLTSGLLLARQASLEGPHLFPLYDHWVQTMFGDRSGTFIRGKKELLLLLKTLTALVPHEPVFALKAHVSHPPRQLAKCLAQVSDYISLASTRLQDLGEKVPSVGQGDSDAGGDVQEAIKHYSHTGCISQAVKEASIFKQPYFLGRFIPSLLRPSTDIGDREKFIDALAREKMIPPRVMRRYERACQEAKDSLEPLDCSGGVVSVLEELPGVVKEDRGMAKLLSRLSSCLDKETSLPPARAVQIVDSILRTVCKTVLYKWDGVSDYRWIGDLLAVLSTHAALHLPLYLRMSELLTTQLVYLEAAQLLGVAVLLCQLFFRSPPMARVEDNGQVLSTGKEYCISLFARLRHGVVAQSLRFGCLFLEQVVHKQHDVALPTCVLHKVVYMYRREKYLHYDQPSFTGGKVLQAVERLLQEHHHLAEQWHSCKVGIEDWITWELEIRCREDGMSQLNRQYYRWREVYSTYLPSSCAAHLFCTLFKSLVHGRYCVDFIAILQELSRVLLENSSGPLSPLLQVLQTTLNEGGCGSEAAKSMMLAVSLPPALLFCGCHNGHVQVVAGFVQNTLAPLVQHMMIMPFHITNYFLQGASFVAESAIRQLCDLSPTFLASLMVHWPLFPSGCPGMCEEVAAVASWIHSGVEGPHPPVAGSVLMAPLSISLWHYWTQHDDPAFGWLVSLPAQAVVLISQCCAHWLAHNPHSHLKHSTVETLLQACIEQEPSAVEVFFTEQWTVPEFVKLQHSQLLTEFRKIFSCQPSSLYPVVLLKLAGKLSAAVLEALLTGTSCFLWLCVVAHAQCLGLSAPLPPENPPLSYLPLSVEFFAEMKTTLVRLVALADSSQLKNVLQQGHHQLKTMITSKLNSSDSLQYCSE